MTTGEGAVGVADGSWLVTVNEDGSLEVSFAVPGAAVPAARFHCASNGEPRAVRGSAGVAADDAARVIDNYLARCAAGGWARTIHDWYPSDDVSRVEIASCSGETADRVSSPVVTRGTDAHVAEALHWAGLPLADGVPGERLAATERGRPVAATSLGRLAWVATVEPAQQACAVYLLAQSDGTNDRVPAWQVASVLRFPHARAGTSTTASFLPADDATTAAGLLQADGNQIRDRATRMASSWAMRCGAIVSELESRLRAMVTPTNAAFILAMAAYALTRLWRLEDFPTFFHGDEAFQVVAAKSLVEHQFKNELGVPLPLYFANTGSWAPLVTVYLHVASTELFGLSVQVARGTSSVVAIVGGAALALFARDSLRLRIWWAVPLLLAAVPTWFLHSRTTFETAYCVSGYAFFLWAYGRYRDGRGTWGVVAVLAAAFTFYTYTNGQLIIAVTAAILAAADARHHWRMRSHLPVLVATGVTCLVPLVAYLRAAPDATTDQLWRVSSYLVRDTPIVEKARQFVLHYAAGLDPRYWFLANPHELSRHAMLGYPNVPAWFVPFVALGLAAALLGVSRPANRLVLVALVATPVGASLADVGITRVLAVIVPLVLLAAIGLDQAVALAGSIARRVATPSEGLPPAVANVEARPSRRSAVVLSSALWVGLALPAGVMARDALVNGPTWFTDYGLYGQQWGAVQVFGQIVARAAASPDDVFLISSTWANGTDVYLPFFVPSLQKGGRVRMGNVRDLLASRRDLSRTMVWVMTADELELARAAKKFRVIDVDSQMRYPDGSPGFAFVRLEYASNLEDLIAVERAARVALRTGQAVVDGQALPVRHTNLDAGSLADIFDGNPRTLGRFNGGNPASIEWSFPVPRVVQRLELQMTAGNWRVAARVLRPGGEIVEVERDIDARSDPAVVLDLPAGEAMAIRLVIASRVHGNEAIIHLRDVTWS